MKNKSILIILLFLSISKGEWSFAQQCPSLNVVGSFNNVISWPQSYANAISNGQCVTFTPPYDPVMCFEYQVPYSDTVLFSLHLNACGSTNSINTGNYTGGCNSVGSTNSTFTGFATFDNECNLISNSAQIGYCAGAVSGDILTICFEINTSTVCDPITICPTAYCGTSTCQTTLPIRLISFIGTCDSQDVKLHWSTATEVDNDYFTIEQTEDGVLFQEVGFVKGAGYSNETIDYEFVLSNNNSFENSFYRLKQTDFDGSFTYSDIIGVTCEKDQLIKVFPIPANDVLTLTSSSEINKYLIFNVSGKIDLEETIEESTKQVDIDVRNLSKGVYFLKVDLDNGDIFSEKIIIQ